MQSGSEINLQRVLVGHRAAVNVVDFDQKYIVSASGDRTIKVWNTQSCEFVRTLNGHKRGIACLQYHGHLVVSGSSDNTIRSVPTNSFAAFIFHVGNVLGVSCDFRSQIQLYYVYSYHSVNSIAWLCCDGLAMRLYHLHYIFRSLNMYFISKWTEIYIVVQLPSEAILLNVGHL